SVDLRADAGFDTQGSDGRGVTLRVYWTNNGDYVTGIEARTVGAPIPDIGSGWHAYSFAIPAGSPTIPAGWPVGEGDGSPGRDADWRYVMTHVDQVQIQFGEVGYAFPIRTWNIGMDNAVLTTVPEPRGGAWIACSILALWLKRR